MDFKKVINGSVIDFSFESGDIATTDGLEESILNSLYTDARAEGKNGWWGDAYNSGQPMGSKLWTLKNAKATLETKNLAKQYCLEALQWLLDEKIVDKLTVSTQWILQGVLYIEIHIYRNQDHRVFKFKEAL